MPELRTLTVELKTPTGESIEGASLDFRLLIDSSRKVAYDGTIGIWSVDDITVTTDADGMASVELYPSVMVKSKYVVRIRSDKYHTYDTFDMPDYDANLADILNLEAGDIVHPTLFKYFIDLEDTYAEHQLGWLKDDGQSVVLVTDLTEDDDFRSAVTTIAGSNNNNNDNGNDNGNVGSNNPYPTAFAYNDGIVKITLSNGEELSATLPDIISMVEANEGQISGDGTSDNPLALVNPFTAAEKEKLAGIAEGAQANPSIPDLVNDFNALVPGAGIDYDTLAERPTHLSDISDEEGDKLDSISADAEINVGTNLPVFRVKESHASNSSNLNILSILFDDADGNPVVSGDSSSIVKIYISSSVFNDETNPLQLGVPPTFIPLIDHQNLLNDVVNHGGDLRVVFSELAIVNEGEDGAEGQVEISGTFTIRAKKVSVDENDNYVLEDIIHITKRDMDNLIRGWEVSGTRILDYASEGLVDTIDVDTQTHGDLPFSRVSGDIPVARISDFPDNTVPSPFRTLRRSAAALNQTSGLIAFNGVTFQPHIGSTDQLDAIWIDKVVYSDTEDPSEDTATYDGHVSFLRNVVQHGGRVIATLNKLDSDGNRTEDEFIVETDKVVESQFGYFDLEELTVIKPFQFGVSIFSNDVWEVTIEPTVIYSSSNLQDKFNIQNDTEGDLPSYRVSGTFDIEDDTFGDLPASRVSGTFDINSKTTGDLSIDRISGTFDIEDDTTGELSTTRIIGHPGLSSTHPIKGILRARESSDDDFNGSIVIYSGVIVDDNRVPIYHAASDNLVISLRIPKLMYDETQNPLSESQTPTYTGHDAFLENLDVDFTKVLFFIDKLNTNGNPILDNIDRLDRFSFEATLSPSGGDNYYQFGAIINAEMRDFVESDENTAWRISMMLSPYYISDQLLNKFDIADDTEGNLPIARVSGDIPANRVSGLYEELPDNWVRPEVRAVDSSKDDFSSGNISFLGPLDSQISSGSSNRILIIQLHKDLFEHLQTPTNENATPSTTIHHSFLNNIIENGGRILLSITQLDSSGDETDNKMVIECDDVYGVGDGNYGFLSLQHINTIDLPGKDYGWAITIEPTTLFASRNLQDKFDIDDDTEGNLPSSRVSGTFDITSDITGDLPSSRVSGTFDIDSDTTGNLPIARVDGDLPANRISDLYEELPRNWVRPPLRVLSSTNDTIDNGEIGFLGQFSNILITGLSNNVFAIELPAKVYDQAQTPGSQNAVPESEGHSSFLDNVVENGGRVIIHLRRLDSSGNYVSNYAQFYILCDVVNDQGNAKYYLTNLTHIDYHHLYSGAAWEFTIEPTYLYSSDGLIDKIDLSNQVEGELSASNLEGLVTGDDYEGYVVVVGENNTLESVKLRYDGIHQDTSDVPDTTGNFVEYDLGDERYNHITITIITSNNNIFTQYISDRTLGRTDDITLGEAYDSTANATKRKIVFKNPTPDIDLFAIASSPTSNDHIAIAIEPSGLELSAIYFDGTLV